MSEIVLVNVADDGTRGETFTCQGPQIKVGKLESSGLRLDHPSVGRAHATIEFEPDGKVWVIDLGSVQGSYVNDQRINKCAIERTDLLRFGDVLFVVEEIKTSSDDSDDASDDNGLDGLKARIDELRKVTAARMAQRAAAGKGNGEPKTATTRIGELIGAAVIGNMVGDEESGIPSEAIAAFFDSLCDSTEKLRNNFPADRIAGEIDGLVELLLPALDVVRKRLEQLSDYTETCIQRGTEFRAGLVKKLKDEFELSEDDAMEIVRSMSDEMKEQIQKITK